METSTRADLQGIQWSVVRYREFGGTQWTVQADLQRGWKMCIGDGKGTRMWKDVWARDATLQERLQGQHDVDAQRKQQVHG
ncbi:hypothetical protein PIB30_074865 [Stylosanthes scabra]|uniref:Uncharacterized protein n=1 Tax=Stylosanthes scabra TaxID=79078 RepID=A0ABU6YQJ4_9FABA|nr:hypothetical protein [Stylosanthes scabra]